MLCFEYLEVVINAAIKVISNTRQDVFKKIVVLREVIAFDIPVISMCLKFKGNRIGEGNLKGICQFTHIYILPLQYPKAIQYIYLTL